MKLQLKYWDCIEHNWKWFFMPVKQPFHNTWLYKWYMVWDEKQNKFKPDCSKLGEIWLIWLGFAIKKVKS
jgi:hypothetical protein